MPLSIQKSTRSLLLTTTSVHRSNGLHSSHAPLPCVRWTRDGRNTTPVCLSVFTFIFLHDILIFSLFFFPDVHPPTSQPSSPKHTHIHTEFQFISCFSVSPPVCLSVFVVRLLVLALCFCLPIFLSDSYSPSFLPLSSLPICLNLGISSLPLILLPTNQLTCLYTYLPI